MKTVIVQRSYDASVAAVFDWLSDSSNYPASPFVLRERLARPGRGTRYGVGAVREITAVGIWFREEITNVEQPHRFDYQIVRSVPPIRHHGGHLAFNAVAGGTHVTWTSTFTIPAPIIGPALEQLAAQATVLVFRNLLNAAATALEAPRYAPAP